MAELRETFLKDYQKPDYIITDVYLTFELDDTKTHVNSVIKVKSNYDESDEQRPLVLNGEHLQLKGIKLDNVSLEEDQYRVDDETLSVFNVPKEFILEIDNEINPAENKALEGLYKSGNIFCTQNEAEGFRRITYYLDRPDVMAKFTTKIIANKTQCPVLLSNGNPIEQGELDSGRHFVVWQDPFPKPCYLYALVAGDLGLVTDEFTTMTGRKIDLRIYCDKGNEGKCDHAMESLKKAMKWDEDKFGREYDLDIFMIVAVDSFNMGAMENKGLNIFNSAYVLANPLTATDDDFLAVEGVVAHEYFHNWTGNRITCRDWFQLTLKEGLTVFRDQLFSGDMNSKAVQRIDDVQSLRTRQFPEDAGPMAHPIKPKSYVKMDNFYTPTVYEKGAEVIRMIYIILGENGFRKGMDKYFELFDGQAVTTEDFVYAMENANDLDLTQFKRWYDQRGTPTVKAQFDYDSTKQQLTLILEQQNTISPKEQEEIGPLHIPLTVGLIGSDGKEIELTTLDKTKSQSSPQSCLEQGLIHLKQNKETLVFSNITSKPTVSLNRSFSAPINIEAPYTIEDQIFIMAHDKDDFNRFEAVQQLCRYYVNILIDDYQKEKELSLPSEYIKAFGQLLSDTSIDQLFKAKALVLPTEDILHQGQNPIDFEATHKVRKFIRKTLAQAYRDKFQQLYQDLNGQEDYVLNTQSIAKRRLKNVALSYLMAIEDEEIDKLCYQQFTNSNNMTDEFQSLALLAHKECKFRQIALDEFYAKWKHVTLVMQKWLAIQAYSPLPDTVERIKELQKDPVYDKTVPNLVRSLIGIFSRNYIHFHSPSGIGYEFMADKVIEIDKLNPQIGARLSGSFTEYKRLKPENMVLMQKQLERIKGTQDLSKNSLEIISKIL